ncbi:MAG: hypothetical protein ACE5G2_07785 [Candidatus Krumholzibacteriia bacterium]
MSRIQSPDPVQVDLAQPERPDPTGAEAPRASRSVLAWFLLLVAAGVFFYHARIYWQWTEDDAFITFRYSQNLAQGEGLVFNAGERVEGYSNFSWVLVGAAAVRAGLDPEGVSKIVGLVAGLLSLVLSWFLALRLVPRVGLTALLAPYYLAVSPLLVQHSVAGLETSLFALLVIASLLVAVGESPPGIARRTLLVLLLLLLSVTRPEGPAVAFVVLLMRGTLISRRWGKHRGKSRRSVGFELLAYAVLFGSYYVWRWSYFGAPFPNTYYAKTSGGLHGIIDGVQYTLDFLRDSGGVLFVGLALVPMLLGRARAVYWTALVTLGLYVGFVVVAGGDWMYHFRFYAHVLPVVAALIAVGIELLLSLVLPGTLRAALLYATLAVVLLATYMSMGNTELRVARIVLPALKSHNYLSQNYEELGLWFKENTASDATIAISDVGAVGYFSERRILDMFGLIDPHIARLGGRMHYKADPEYVLSRQPDYIVLVSLNDQGAGYSFQRIPDYSMNALPEFHEQYDLMRTVPQHWHSEYVLVYRRKS